MTNAIETNYIEEFVNCVPSYEGGKIGGLEQYGAALSFLRLHQINRVNKEGKYNEHKLFRLLLDTLSSDIRHYQCRRMGLMPDFIDDCKKIIKDGLNLSSNKEELLGELATYSIENAADTSLRILFHRAKSLGVDIPAGEWQVMKQSKLMVKPNWRRTKRGFVMFEQDKLIDYYGLEEKRLAYDEQAKKEVEVEIKILDGEDMLFYCPDFASKLVEQQKKFYKWEELEKILLEEI